MYNFFMKKRAKIQGFYVDLLDFNEVISRILQGIKEKKNIHVVTINPEIIQSAKKRPELAKIINEAEIITPDGVGIRIALKMKGISQQQVTGVDLSKKMLEICAKDGIKVALIGAKPEILKLAARNIKEQYKGIQIVYFHDGYFNDNYPIIEEIVNSGAEFVLCAMGSPKQEYFISELKKVARGICAIGVGGTFDVLSGTVKLAPAFYRKAGLEWLYRAVKQPERLKRIFPALPIFFFQSIIDGISSKD